MNLLIALGWRNIWRNKRRSLLTVAAIAFAAFLTVVFRGIAIGTWEYNIRSTVEMFAGYLQVQRIGYQDSPSLRKSFLYPGAVEPLLRRTEGVTAWTPRITADGLLSFGGNSAGAALLGLAPDFERRVSRFHERVRSGRMVEAQSRDEIVLGATLLRNLKAEIGDTIVVLAQGYDGVMGNLRFRIVGAVKFGIPEFDAMTAVVSLPAAQELLAMEGRVSLVAVGVNDLRSVDHVQTILVDSLRSAQLEDLTALPWMEVMPELKQAMEFDSTNDSIFLGVLIIIVAFGILNTVLMSVTERYREFGITLAMGMESRQLVRLVILETILIAMVGVAAGVIAGHLVNMYLAAHPIVLSGQLADSYEQYGFQPMVISTVRLIVPLAVGLAVLVLGILASLYPAYRVSRLEPLKGIRHT